MQAMETSYVQRNLTCFMREYQRCRNTAVAMSDHLNFIYSSFRQIRESVMEFVVRFRDNNSLGNGAITQDRQGPLVELVCLGP